MPVCPYFASMRFYLLLISLAQVLLLIHAFAFNKQFAAVECKTRHKVPAYDIENMKNRKLPESKEGKCMMACILRKLNVISQDGKFEVQTVKGWIADKYKDDTTKLTRAYARADNCAQELPSVEEDECEYAAKLLECTKRKKGVHKN